MTPLTSSAAYAQGESKFAHPREDSGMRRRCRAGAFKSDSGERRQKLKLIKDEGIAATQDDFLTVIQQRKFTAPPFIT